MRRAFKEARALAAQGDYPGALEKHIVFHENILNVQPASAGVRVSFALGSWIELGKKYPLALDALREIRDRDTKKIEGGLLDTDLFNDVVTINDYLGDSAATVTLFKRIVLQDVDFSASVYSVVHEALLERKEFDLLRKCMGDPMKKLEEERKFYRELQIMEWMFFFRRRALMDSRKYNFIRSVLILMAILRETGDDEGARQIRDEALKTLDAPEIRDALAS